MKHPQRHHRKPSASGPSLLERIKPNACLWGRTSDNGLYVGYARLADVAEGDLRGATRSARGSTPTSSSPS
jgi:hypothetical protein